MNANLTRPVEDQEIRKSLFPMHPHKAPGPDGMSPFFFQTYCNVIGTDMCHAVKDFFVPKTS